MSISLLLKDLNFLFLFVITAAGVVLCGGRKKSPHSPHTSLVQIIPVFYFWSFEIKECILKNQKSHMFRFIFFTDSPFARSYIGSLMRLL